METIKLKTNIKCSGCISQVTPSLNATVGEGDWDVDIQNPDKVLTIATNNVSKTDVVKAVEKAGFKAQDLS